MSPELTLNQICRGCSVESMGFDTTDDLKPKAEIIGQPRGVRAIEFGISIGSPGYNVYVMGDPGTGRTTATERFIESRAAKEPTPSDWAYVNNFGEPQKPIALRLPPGVAARLRQDMDQLVEGLQKSVPQAFESEAFRDATHQLQHTQEEKRQQLFADLQAQAEAVGSAVIALPSGMQIVPVKDGQPMSPQEFASLPEEARQAWRKASQALEDRLDETLHSLHELEAEAEKAVKELVRNLAGSLVEGPIADLKKRYAEDEETVAYLDSVKTDLLDHIDLFRPAPESDTPQSMQLSMQLAAQLPAELRFRRYRVNVIIDNGKTKGAPVIVEHNPSLPRLVGRIEHETRFGGEVVTDFTLIRGGALQAANGGFLVVRARDLAAEPGAWDTLKRALVEGMVRPDDPVTRSISAARTLDPEAIPLNVKVIMVGPAALYHLLYEGDEDFRTIFKLMADFDDQMPRTPENEREYAMFIASQCKLEGLLPFDRTGVSRMINHGSRLAESQSKLSTRFGDIADLLREASFWAGEAGNQAVTAQDVQRALDEREFRRNRVESRLRDEILKGTLLIDTKGAVVGQVNGLSVAAVGRYAFGHPTRVTARTFAGKEGVVQIDREVELAGPIHNKGLMTLVGYLGGQYAEENPLSLSAQITFEQTYGGIEGDSASSTELFALLSSLSGIPVQQGIAVTGSVNQRGEIQAIGGVMEKVEGWFEVCKARGLNGDHGAIIPASNIDDLMIRESVGQAVSEGKFHLWAISTVDEGLEILTGRPASEVHSAAKARLAHLAEVAKKAEEKE
jgi:lon-related putative ATP-dependent protease